MAAATNGVMCTPRHGISDVYGKRDQRIDVTSEAWKIIINNLSKSATKYRIRNRLHDTMQSLGLLNNKKINSKIG